jgi:protease IV
MKNKLSARTALAIMLGIFVAVSVASCLLPPIGWRMARKTTAVTKNTYLIVDPRGVIAEYRSAPPFDFWRKGQAPTLGDMTRALNRAAKDSHIVGVILKPGGVLGFAEIRELRNAVLDFKASHKPVYAYLEMATDRDYYLASVADSIVISPSQSAGLIMTGLGVSSTYLAKTFDKVGVKFHVLHVGEYKGAYENLERESMSGPLRESLQALVDDLYQTYTQEIMTARPAVAPALENELLRGKHLLINGSEAVSKGFADLSMDWGDLRERLARGGKFRSQTPGRYVRNWREGSLKSREVAVLYAGGEISYGSDDSGPMKTGDGIQSDDLIKQIRDLREDDDVAAVVLRVNSPGGSSLASEVILRELLRLKAKKPVVVSMGNVAASGGYYISCAANRIIAQPNTITGSIGVVGVMPSAEELFKKIGARVETVEKGKWALFFRVDRDMTAEQKSVLMDLMNGIYDEFVNHVAEGRHLTPDEVKSVAAGRVWTGTQALERRLVDELGGLDLAVQRACELAKVSREQVVVRSYPQGKDLFRYLLRQFNTLAASCWDRLSLTDDERAVRLALDFITRFERQRDFVQMILPLDLP